MAKIKNGISDFFLELDETNLKKREKVFPNFKSFSGLSLENAEVSENFQIKNNFICFIWIGLRATIQSLEGCTSTLLDWDYSNRAEALMLKEKSLKVDEFVSYLHKKKCLGSLDFATYTHTHTGLMSLEKNMFHWFLELNSLIDNKSLSGQKSMKIVLSDETYDARKLSPLLGLLSKKNIQKLYQDDHKDDEQRI